MIVSKKNKKKYISSSQQRDTQSKDRGIDGIDLENLVSQMMGNSISDDSKRKKKSDNDKKKVYDTRKSDRTQNNQGHIRNKRNNDFTASAPYNFIPFTQKVHSLEEKEQISHLGMSEELNSGVIKYEIEAQTPIFIDDGNGEFHKNQYGEYSISGSTMRGLIRSNVQILGLSSIEDDIDNYELMYRNVAGRNYEIDRKKYKIIMGEDQIPVPDGKKGKQMSVVKNVKAGYIYNQNGTYIIYKTVKDKIHNEMGEMNYYILSERKIVNEYQQYEQCKSKDKYKNKDKFAYNFFLTDNDKRMQHKIDFPFIEEDRNGRTHYKGEESKAYKPYFEEISYEIKNIKDVIAVDSPECYEKKGYIISSGKMNEKKALYIIPQIDKEKEAIEISPEDIRAFKIDIKKRESKLKNFGGREFFDLPKEGELKPVFYIEVNGDKNEKKRLYFGFTPRLRVFYPKTIQDGIPDEHKLRKLDYAKSIFGYVDETGKKNYKSKVSFSDAVITNSPGEMEQVQYIMGEPGPTCYMNYLEQDGDETTTYNSEQFCLRGVKQYWLKDKVEPSQEIENKEMVSTMKPLPEKTKFVGKIRYHNLTEEELGLLLWSIRLEESSWMNVGKAKAYGYGAVKINIVYAKEIDLKKAYSLTKLCLDPYTDIEIDKKINAYKSIINQTLEGKNIDNHLSVKTLLAMKDSKKILPKTGYMSLDDYKSKNKLPKVQDLVDLKD